MRPEVTETRLYSYLVTRPTGRQVRERIEDRLRECGREMLAVLDLRHVLLIDFSCADEIVAKLVVRSGRPVEPPPPRCFLLVRGVADRHREPIESALDRQGLAVAAEDVNGEPLLLGRVETMAATAWHELWRLGRAPAAALEDRLGAERRRVRRALEELHARGLVIREGERFVSFRCALEEGAEGSGPPG